MKYVHGTAFPDADTFMASQLGADGRYQGDNLDAALRFVTNFDVAIDGGAHVGTWTRILAKRFGSVIAVEPAADTFEALSINVAGDACQNVDLRNAALGAHAGFVSLTIDPVNEERQNTGARYVQPTGTIPMVAIDDWRLPSLGFLKLDVEGSEFAALLGARLTIARCKPIVLFENKNLWKRFGVDREGPQKLLTSLGYKQVASVSSDLIWKAMR